MIGQENNILPHKVRAITVGLEASHIKGPVFPNNQNAHKETEKITHFVESTLRWQGENGKTTTFTDNIANQKNLFKDIRKEINDMFKSKENKGNNKYTLNFFSFCGFGFVNH